MKCINLIEAFDREVEVLEVKKHEMIYVLDQKNEVMDSCGIEKINLDTGEKKRLMTLDYTRIYESFQTYGALKDFFFAINVLQDYRLRLRRINKYTWQSEGEMILEALGEILNIYPLNQQYLLIVDEVKNSPDLLDVYNIDENQNEYLDVCYLYDCFSKQRYPLTDKRLHGLFEHMCVHEKDEDETMLYFSVCQYEDPWKELEEKTESGLYRISLDNFIDAIVNKKPLFLQDIYISDINHAVRFFDNDHDDIAYRIMDFEQKTEQIMIYDPEENQVNEKSRYILQKNGMYYYNKFDYNVYYNEFVDDMTFDETMEDEIVNVKCLTEPENSIDYHTSTGVFAAAFDKTCYITSFYKEVMIKEYEFHEYVAVHQNDQCDTFEARFLISNDQLILLKTFLAL